MTPAELAARVSVVVPVRDMGEELVNCLTALTRQDAAPREILVVDNGSVDNTAEVIRRFPVTYLHETRPGAAAARNRGIRAASGEIVAFTDADCVPSRGWVRNLAAAFATDDIHVVAGTVACLQKQHSLLSTYSTLIRQYDSAATLSHPRFPYAPTANVAVRREALLEVGLFDTEFLTYEGADLFYRMHRAGLLRWEIAPKALVLYETRKEWRGFVKQNFRYGLGYARFFRKYAEDLDARRVRFPGALSLWKERSFSGWQTIRASPAASKARSKLLALHVLRETALIAGVLRFRPPTARRNPESAG